MYTNHQKVYCNDIRNMVFHHRLQQNKYHLKMVFHNDDKQNVPHAKTEIDFEHVLLYNGICQFVLWHMLIGSANSPCASWKVLKDRIRSMLICKMAYVNLVYPSFPYDSFDI